ncbi:hypothetical protein [Planomonospora sp. ID67723]|nr:hypothetical protein [Planomonospora sp. ID67723]
MYRGRRQYVWNNDRDSAYLLRPSGQVIDSCSYNSTRVDAISCL